jgi:peptidylamidoglycolate lyase
MVRRIKLVIFAAVLIVGGIVIGLQLRPAEVSAKATTSSAAVPSEKGGQDLYGPYEVVADWPKPMSQLPGHENWTWGSVDGVFAQNANRVYILQRGEVPVLKRPPVTILSQIAPSLSFPISSLPFRNVGQGPVSSPPGPPGSEENWKGKYGVDGRWEDCLVVVDSTGKIIESWTQWDKLFKHPHAIFMNPYDPEKAVWVVDDEREAVFKFSNDGEKLLQTIGTPNVAGNDETHLGRPTFLAWLPDGTMFLSDGYVNTRVVKYDKNGKYLMSWGQKGNPPNDTRPGYFNTVHGIAVDPVTRHVFVNDRENRRMQVFDENGKFIDQWSYGPVSSVYFIYMSADRHIWAADAATSKIIEYDLNGHLLYSWGTFGDWPGSLWGVHEMSVDPDGNLYVSEVEAGRAQKFAPRKGANPEFLMGKPPKGAW